MSVYKDLKKRKLYQKIWTREKILKKRAIKHRDLVFLRLVITSGISNSLFGGCHNFNHDFKGDSMISRDSSYANCSFLRAVRRCS
jgi:hypothetical protein